MTIAELNNLSSEVAMGEFLKCCGSSSWAKKMLANRPFTSKKDLFSVSNSIWAESSVEDGLEAFQHHPKIGDLKSLEKKFASTKDWAGGEQSGVNTAAKETLIALAEGNNAYEKKFGYIFIVCATGKSANEMLSMLNERLKNDPKDEIKIAMNEQNKITLIRLEKLLA
jgi:2-oxo-4-hydroxy-4-carboxy-5-ureidoimidazoline decarboxylase